MPDHISAWPYRFFFTGEMCDLSHRTDAHDIAFQIPKYIRQNYTLNLTSSDNLQSHQPQNHSLRQTLAGNKMLPLDA